MGSRWASATLSGQGLFNWSVLVCPIGKAKKVSRLTQKIEALCKAKTFEVFNRYLTVQVRTSRTSRFGGVQLGGSFLGKTRNCSGSPNSSALKKVITIS